MAYLPKRMYQGQLTTTLTTTLATTTTSKQWVVTDIEICNTDSSAHTVTLAMPGSGAGNQIFSALSVAANASYQWSGRIVLESTETITGGADAGALVTVTISGAEG